MSGCSRPKKNSMGEKATCPLHSKIEVQEITFSDNHIVEKDTLGNFGSPEWIKGRNANDQSPACYTRNKRVKIKAKFKVTTKPSQSEIVKIKGSCIFDSKTLEWESDVNVAPSSNEITTSEMTSNTTLPDHVACYDLANITWQTNPANIGWSGAGTSSHLLYVTLGDPNGTPAYWTLLDVSCRAAHGQTSEPKVVSKVFEPLKTSVGDGNGLKRKRDGKELTYYKDAIHTPGASVFSTYDLLHRSDGTGRCGAWARFLVDMYKTHGITGGQVIGVVPDSSEPEVFLVNNCTFHEPHSLPAPFTHVGHSECKKDPGIKGQGKDNPQFLFGDHALVKYSTDTYDPSYGVGPKPDLRSWEIGAIAGLGKGGYTVFTYAGDTQAISKECSKGFINYTVVSGDTLSKIAQKFGIGSWSLLYNHPYNQAFKASRTNPNLIYPGDKLYIPRDIAIKVNILKIS